MGRQHLKRRLLLFGACFAGERMRMPFVSGLAILPPVPWTGAQFKKRLAGYAALGYSVIKELKT
jgi:hypothetical protein